MKALVVCDDAEVIAQLDTALQQYGIDTILYRWLLKALDNIEEISPDFTIISASDYPRHWKTLSQFINSGIGRAANKIILYTPEPLPSEERKKADALGILGCFSSLDKCEGGLETLHSFLGIKEREAKSGTTDKTISASLSAPNNTEAADEKSALAAVSENEETEIPDTQEISTEESPLEMEHSTENTVSNPDIANSYALKKTALESTVGSDTDTSRTNIKEATDESAAETVESATIEEKTTETAASTEETLCDSAQISENACTEPVDSTILQEKMENTDLDTANSEAEIIAQTEETSSVAESAAETVESATIEEKTTETAASTEEILSASAPLAENACTEPADAEIPEKKTENTDLDTANSEVETTTQTNESHSEPPLNAVAESAAETVESATIEERTTETAASTEETLCDSVSLSENTCTETADSTIPQDKTENAELDTETPEAKTIAQTEKMSFVAESAAETGESATIEEKTTETAASTEETLCDSAPLSENGCTESANSEIPQEKTENAELNTANSEIETTAQTEETSSVAESAAETVVSATIEEKTTETAASTEEILSASAPLPKNACTEPADAEIPEKKTENTDLDTANSEVETTTQTNESHSEPPLNAVAESAAETVESATIEKETTETSASTEETLCDSVPLSENACVETADSEIPQEKTENEDLDTANSEAETVAQTAEPRFEPPLNAVAPESDTTVYDPPETETAFADETVIPSADEILSNVTQETKIHEAVLSSGEETIISTHDEDSAFPLNENEDAECKTVLNGAKEITADAFAAPPAGTSDLPSTKKPEKKRLVVKSDAKAAQGSLFPKANCTPAFIERFFQKLQSEALSTKAKNSSAHTASEYPEMTEKDASSLDCKLPSVNSIAKETDSDTRSCLKIPRVDTILTETASAYELCSEKNQKAPLPDYKIPAADSILKDKSFSDDMRRDYRIPNVFSIFFDKNDLTAPPQTDIRIPSVASLLQTTETAGDSKNAEEKQGRKSLLHKIEKIYEK